MTWSTFHTESGLHSLSGVGTVLRFEKQGPPMSKQKTKKGVVRRMKLTKSGKVKRRHAFTSHLLVRRDRKRKRNLRRAAIVPGRLGIQMAKCLGRFKIPTSVRRRSPAPAKADA